MRHLLDTLSVHEAIDEKVAHARVEATAGHSDLDGLAAAFLLFTTHRSEEETLWLPLYEKRCTPPVNATADVLRRDHRRIHNLFSALPGKAGLDRVDLLEDLAGALEHHDQREKTWFKPLLNEALTREERAELLDHHAAASPVPPNPIDAPWSPPPRYARIEGVREVLLSGKVVEKVPLPPEPFREKAVRFLRDFEALTLPEKLSRLRRIGLLWLAAEKVAAAG